jgi:hypothetical protein
MKGRPSETLRHSAFLEKLSTNVVIDSQAMLANHSWTSKYKVDVSCLHMDFSIDSHDPSWQMISSVL